MVIAHSCSMSDIVNKLCLSEQMVLGYSACLNTRVTCNQLLETWACQAPWRFTSKDKYPHIFTIVRLKYTDLSLEFLLC